MGNTCCFLFSCIDQASVGVVERWGRFERLAEPGLHVFNPFAGECLAAVLSTRISSLDVRIGSLPNADPNEKFYAANNQYKMSGQALEFKQLDIHAWKSFEKGKDVHMQAAPSQAELLFRTFKVKIENKKSNKKMTVMEKYGNAASE